MITSFAQAASSILLLSAHSHLSQSPDAKYSENFYQMLGSGKMAFCLLLERDFLDAFSRRALQLPRLSAAVVTAATDVHEKWFSERTKCFEYGGNANIPASKKNEKGMENSSLRYKLKCCQRLHTTCGMWAKVHTKFIIYIYLHIFFKKAKIILTRLKVWPNAHTFSGIKHVKGIYILRNQVRSAYF